MKKNITIRIAKNSKSTTANFYIITGLKGNPNLELSVFGEVGLEDLSNVLRKDIEVFNDFLAIKYNNTIEVYLSPILLPYSIRKIIDSKKEEPVPLINVDIHFNLNQLNINIESGKKGKLLPLFSNLIRGRINFLPQNSIILKIENYIKPTSDGMNNDIKSIVNSVLFDIEFNYDMSLEMVNIDGATSGIVSRKNKTNELPKEKINLVFKKYIPELIQYFHIATKVDFTPFKYVCYYHILEYFSDKSAYHIVSTEIKKILLSPDFHLKTNQYVNQAINLFKKENEKFIGDKIKIERVLRQYIKREDFKKIMDDIGLLDYFSKEVIFDFVRPFKLPAVNFDQDGNFYSELTKRIYSLRCSIIHSNPNYDETKAVPFNATPPNIKKLKTEIELIKEIARIIIIESKE